MRFRWCSAVVLTIALSVAPIIQAADCTNTSVGLVPLIDGEGLYPSGLNFPPLWHSVHGEEIAKILRAKPTNVLMSVGMSNTREEFGQFLAIEAKATDRAPNLVMVNGATDGQVASKWASTRNLTPYSSANAALAARGLTPQDVTVLWVKLTNVAAGDPALWRAKFKTDLKQALTLLKAHYPNVAMIFLSARIYGGYETPGIWLNPEPYAYQTGLVVKDVVTEHLAGTFLPDVWLSWGPYLWADGLHPRSDGVTWACGDFEVDGVHPSLSGETKVAGFLGKFFRTDPVARIWFLNSTTSTPPPPPPNPRPTPVPGGR